MDVDDVESLADTPWQSVGDCLLADEEVKQLFALFDSNADGVIIPDELEQFLHATVGIITAEQASSLRNLMQTQGFVSWPIFLQWARQQSGFEIYQILRELFLIIDRDRRGWLSRDQLEMTLALLQSCPGMVERASVSGVGGKGSRLMEEDLWIRLDRDGNDQISCDEFLGLLKEQSRLQFSLTDLKRLKKTLMQLSTSDQVPAIALVEVDCDLGAGIPGARSGIEMLKSAVKHQQDLSQIAERLILEIEAQQRPMVRDELAVPAEVTPHARHIETIAGVMADAAGLVASTLEQGLFPIVLAGDHSTAAATMAGIRRAHPSQRLGVIWIDAHADIHSPFTSPSGNMHGMPLAIASAHDNLPQAINAPDQQTCRLWRQLQELSGSGLPAIKLEDLVYVAVRDTEPAEDVTIANHSIPVIRTDEVRAGGPDRAARRCLDHLAEVDLIYVSFDVDGLDSTICKGTGTPVSGGLWLDEAVAILRLLLEDSRVCCWEICEINPHLDVLNTLAEVSLTIFRGGLDVLQQRFSKKR